MSSTLDQILGRVTEDAPPVQAARTASVSPARKSPPTDKEEKKLRDTARRSSVVASIIGMSEGEEEGIIPNDAKRLDPFSTDHIPGMKEVPNLNSASPSEPSLSMGDEELIPPSAALVAPDITPKVFQLIDPSQVPAPPQPTSLPPGAPSVSAAPPGEQGALDTILGRDTGTPPIAAESFMQAISPGEIKAKVAEKLVPALDGGGNMPEHKEGDGKTIFRTFRSLVG